jgi:hypothetical protein
MAVAPAEITPLSSAYVRSSRDDGLLRRLLRHRMAQVGLLIIALLLFVAFFASQLSHIDPVKNYLVASTRWANRTRQAQVFCSAPTRWAAMYGRACFTVRAFRS